jgi:hypothetical protein
MQNNKVQLPTQLSKRMKLPTKSASMPTTHVTPNDKRRSLFDFTDSQDSRSDHSKSLTQSNSRSTASRSSTSSQNSTATYRLTSLEPPPTQEQRKLRVEKETA